MKEPTERPQPSEGNSDALQNLSSHRIDCQVIHGVARETAARWRIRIPKLAGNPTYANRLQRLVTSLYFVSEVRVNAAARSLIVEYSLDDITVEEAAHQLIKSIQQAAFWGMRSQFQ